MFVAEGRRRALKLLVPGQAGLDPIALTWHFDPINCMLRRTASPQLHRIARMSTTAVGKLSQPVLSPPVQRGLAVLDRSLFSLDVPLLAAVVPTAQTTQYRNNELKK